MRAIEVLNVRIIINSSFSGFCDRSQHNIFYVFRLTTRQTVSHIRSKCATSVVPNISVVARGSLKMARRSVAEILKSEPEEP